MVTTGVSARGIDVRNVMHIINFDLPSVDHGGIDEYVHRVGMFPPFPILRVYIFTDLYVGRTARIGNEGLATSFYNDDDEPLAQQLVNILTECKQEIPDFLSQYKVADNEVDWNDNSDAEDDGEDTAAGGGDASAGWGSSGDAGNAGNTGSSDADQAWGTNGTTPTANGFDNHAWDAPAAPGSAAPAW